MGSWAQKASSISIPTCASGHALFCQAHYLSRQEPGGISMPKVPASLQRARWAVRLCNSLQSLLLQLIILVNNHQACRVLVIPARSTSCLLAMHKKPAPPSPYLERTANVVRRLGTLSFRSRSTPGAKKRVLLIGATVILRFGRCCNPIMPSLQISSN